VERETDLIELAIHGPEVARVHLAVTGPARLDRGLVHRLDAARADRVELRLVDRSKQADRGLRQLGEPLPAHPDAGGRQALMLAVERQVPGELVDQKPSGETHIRAAPLQYPLGCRQGEDLRGAPDFDHRPAVLEDLIAPRTLGNPVGHLLADDLVLVG
jgi:hypothetical protein